VKILASGTEQIVDISGEVTELYAEINGHRVLDLSRASLAGPSGYASVCVRCGARFADRLEMENAPCPPVARTHNHDLVTGDDGLLYCRHCPLVAYDLADVTSEPDCPLPLRPR
jgi:hypothetical protein